ncbi:hypothetical protein Bbelb_026230 [Branchiostoma belcheri]|nr:hypothetical protein Bbelb_026230 [Branchiostoma belcheri]
MQKQHNASSQSASQPLTAGDLRENIDEDVENTSYTFMKNIRGTAAYFKDQLLNLLAKINTIGPPTWFITVSANDLNWPELFMTLNPNLTYEQAKALPQQEKWNLMRSDPVMCAIHFNRRTDALLRFILNSPQHPIGEIRDHWIRIEFQTRGSPHLHCMFWVENAPDLDTIEGKQSAPEFIDKYVSTQLPDDKNSLLYSLVSKYQTHHHTSTCKKYRVNCRFHFPREVSNTTRLRLDVDPNRSAQFYVTKRTQQDIWINAYSPTLLLHMQSNMDIQMIGSKYGAAYYACMYISKAEPENLQAAIFASLSHLPPDSTKRTRLAQIGNTVLSHRLVSAQEVGYRLAHLPLIRSSRQTVSINTRPPHMRMRLLKPRDELDELDNTSTDIFVKGIAQYYALRPHGDPWDKMSLYTFAASYSISSTKPSTACENFKLQQCEKWIKKRYKHACVRGTKLSSGNGDDYFYSLLYLYCPWRNENDILSGHNCAQDAFIAKKDLFDYSLAQHIHFTSEIEQAIMQVRLLTDDLSNIASTLAPNITHQQLQTEHDFDIETLNLDTEWTTQNARQAAGATQTSRVEKSSENVTTIHDDSLAWNILSRYTMTDDAFYHALSNMSLDQQQVFNTIKDHFLQLKRHQTDPNIPKPQPLRLFVTGGAGCGKSFLIKILNEYLIRISTCPTSPVILTAPTGVAAYNIGVNHRQHGDKEYTQILNRIRIGLPNSADIALLSTRLKTNTPTADHGTWTPVLHAIPPQLTTVPGLLLCRQYPHSRPQYLDSCCAGSTPTADHGTCTPVLHAVPPQLTTAVPLQLTTVPGLLLCMQYPLSYPRYLHSYRTCNTPSADYSTQYLHSCRAGSTPSADHGSTPTANYSTWTPVVQAVPPQLTTVPGLLLYRHTPTANYSTWTPVVQAVPPQLTTVPGLLLYRHTPTADYCTWTPVMQALPPQLSTVPALLSYMQYQYPLRRPQYLHSCHACSTPQLTTPSAEPNISGRLRDDPFSSRFSGVPSFLEVLPNVRQGWRCSDRPKYSTRRPIPPFTCKNKPGAILGGNSRMFGDVRLYRTTSDHYRKRPGHNRKGYRTSPRVAPNISELPPKMAPGLFLHVNGRIGLLVEYLGRSEQRQPGRS